jgi:hypothetical protein
MVRLQKTPEAFMIDLRTSSPEGLFSALDPSPFRERDLDPRAVEHIVQWAADAPPRAPLLLRVHVPQGEIEPVAAPAATAEAVRHIFAYEVQLLDRRHRRNVSRMVRWLSAGLGVMALLLWLHMLCGKRWPDSVVAGVVGEALVIAGWVSLWVPVERLGFDGWLLREQLRLYQRLAAMGVEIVDD